MKKLLDIFAKVIVVIFFMGIILQITIPVSLQTASKNFEFDKVTTCTVDYFSQEMVDGNNKLYYYQFEFDTNSREYSAFIELLNSTKYRRKFISYFNTIGDSITINPYGAIDFSTDDSSFRIAVFGKDFSMGKHMNRIKYAPQGGNEFQQDILKFIHDNGILISKEEF